MVKLVKNIEGNVTLMNQTEIKTKSIDIELDGGDYIEVTNFIGFFQDLTFVDETEILNKPPFFGLNNGSRPCTTIEISY